MAESVPDRRLQRTATSSSRLGALGQRFGLQRQRTPNESADDLRGPLGLKPLRESRDAVVELIFVHGFRGGSRKTWTYNDDHLTFWPEYWLTEDNAFACVNIYTFGYNADYAERRVVVSKINDFGLQLLENLVSSPFFRRNSANRIILVGHSLGGLVIKRAFNLSKNPEYHDFSRRFHTLFFLATPHRGADSQTMLYNILRAATSNAPRNYPIDIDPSASAVENINENFRLNHNGIKFYSFFETLPSFPNTSELVVEKHLSILDLADERTVPVNADHLSVCRFPSSDDPAYHAIRDALAATVQEIVDEVSDPQMVRDQLDLLADYLGVPGSEDEELDNLEDTEVPGSCSWLPMKKSFREWRDVGDSLVTPASTRDSRPRSGQRKKPRFFWLTGAPGTGKSVLAAHVIRHLKQEDRECSFYFLKHTDKSKQSLSGLLKSIAYQMARQDVNLRRALISMREDDSLTAEVNDFRAVWKQLFVQKIFHTESSQRQYWVIDALDECHGGHDLVPLLSKIPDSFPISIFLTSRKDMKLDGLLARQPLRTEHIQISDTKQDIRLYLEANKEALPVDDETEIQDLIQKLLNKSNGSFLWIHLVLQQLRNSWSDVATEEALENVPVGMYELYTRILANMADKQNEALAKTTLQWVICAARPLTTAELCYAIRLDIGHRVQKLEKMIEAVCGQLVIVDKQGRVQLVHDTVRDFLLDRDLDSTFAVDKGLAHERLAYVCLKYLIVEDYKGLPTRRPPQNSADNPRPAFHEYANLFWSEHIVKSPAANSDNRLNCLETFLEKSVLSWVEDIARKGDLSLLTQTAKNLKSYVERRVDFQSPLSCDLLNVQDWAMDLIRLVTVFGRHLLRDPSAVHGIIPALCPKNSILYRKFGNANIGLEVVGTSAKGWADRISSISFSPNYSTALACCQKRYAVGLRQGGVILYYSSTCQEALRIDFDEPVKHVLFSHAHNNSWIVICGRRSMGMWNFETGNKIWFEPDMESEPIALVITDDDKSIVAATKKDLLVTYNATKGTIIEQSTWIEPDASDTRIRPPPPQRVYISSELSLLALIYRNKPLRLFDLQYLKRPRQYGGHASVEALAFNSSFDMMAVAFFDGEIRTVGLWNLQKQASTTINASHLTASTDGKTLVAGTNTGTVHLLDFETLGILHTIKFNDEEIVSLTFSDNALRFLDIRRQEFNVWEPAALVRRKDNSETTSASQGQTYSTAPSQPVLVYAVTEENTITSMVTCSSGDFIFCGKENGTISVYETSRGKFVQDLCQHVNTAITYMDWNETENLLVSADSSSRLMLHRVKPVQMRSSTGSKREWRSQQLLEKRLSRSEAIRQVLASADGRYILVSTSTADYLWGLDGTELMSHDCNQSPEARTSSQRWTTHPRHKRQLVEIDKSSVHYMEWEKGSNSNPTIRNLVIEPRLRVDVETREIGVHFLKLGDDHWAAFDNSTLSRPLVWPAPVSSLTSTTATETALRHLRSEVGNIRSLVGMYRSQLVFVDLDHWVCSMRLDEAGHEQQHAPHFPIPHCWQGASRRLVALVTSKGDFVIAKGDELVVVKKGLA